MRVRPKSPKTGKPLKEGRKCSPKAFEEISRLVAHLEEMHQQAVKAYTPIVNNIIHTGSRDAGLIEHTLDRLMDFCGNPDALELFRRLCRHYYFLNPAAAAEFVLLYRRTWDPPASPRRKRVSSKPGKPKSPKAGKKR
jgi:hypothetical protein